MHLRPARMALRFASLKDTGMVLSLSISGILLLAKFITCRLPGRRWRVGKEAGFPIVLSDYQNKFLDD